MKNMVRLISPYDSYHAYSLNMETAFLVQTPEELIEYMQSCFKESEGKAANYAEFSTDPFLLREERHVKKYSPYHKKGFMSLYMDLKKAFENNSYFEVKIGYCWEEHNSDFPNFTFFKIIKGNMFRGHVVDRI